MSKPHVHVHTGRLPQLQDEQTRQGGVQVLLTAALLEVEEAA